MSRKYTKIAILAKAFEVFSTSTLYTKAVIAFEEAGNEDGAAVIATIWSEDTKARPAHGRSIECLNVRNNDIVRRYNVEDYTFLRELWDVAQSARYRSEDLMKIQKLIGSCSWHIKRASNPEEVILWESTQQTITEYMEQFWAIICGKAVHKSYWRLFQDAQNLWEATKQQAANLKV